MITRMHFAHTPKSGKSTLVKTNAREPRLAGAASGFPAPGPVEAG